MQPKAARKAKAGTPKRRGLFRAALVLAIVSLIAAFAPPAAAWRDGSPRLFGTSATVIAEAGRFAKWRQVQERHDAEAARREALCVEEMFAGAEAPHCQAEPWTELAVSLVGMSPREQVEAVNRYMNARPYATDLDNYGQADYWATPAEFMARGGDCEDFVIAKYFALRFLGFGDHALRLVTVVDLRGDVAHMVLAVQLDGETLMLDNQIEQIVEIGRVRHYRAVYSLNAQHLWVHRTL